MTARRNPPYGRVQAKRIAAGDLPRNGVWVYCGADAWARAEASLRYPSRGTLVWPGAEPPDAFRWPVTGLDCLILHESGEGGLTADELRELAIELVRSGAALVVAVGAEAQLGSPIWTARPEVHRDVA